MSADVGSSEAEAARNARLHALCSRPMRLIPAFPLSSGEAETGIKALLSHKVTGARAPCGATDGRDAIEIDARATELVLHYSAAATIFQFEVRSSLFLLYM
jgi:hypothetical protein